MSVPNISKLFQYLQAVATKPIEVDWTVIGGRTYPPQVFGDDIEVILLNDTFFLTDSCQMCGGCDPAVSNIYTQSEYENILNATSKDFERAGLDPAYLNQLRAGIIPITYNINGKSVTAYKYQQHENRMYLPIRGEVINRCSWCFYDSEERYKCRIHPVESITCIMPHLRFYHMKNRPISSMGIYQFGRNWALCCPVAFSEPETETQFEINKRDRMQKLEKLHQCGLDLNIDTYIPKVLEYINDCTFDNYKEKLRINTISGKSFLPRKLF